MSHPFKGQAKDGRQTARIRYAIGGSVSDKENRRGPDIIGGGGGGGYSGGRDVKPLMLRDGKFVPSNLNLGRFPSQFDDPKPRPSPKRIGPSDPADFM